MRNPRKKLSNQQILWDYNKGDYIKARRLINMTDWEALLSPDINISLMNWQNQFLHIMEECIPKSSPSSRHHLPWLTKGITRLIKRKNNLFKVWKKQGTLTLHNKYKLARNKVTKVLKSAKLNFFRNLNTGDQKLFWKTVHILTKCSTSVPALVGEFGKAFTNQEKADALSEFFKKCLNYSVPPLTFADMDIFGTGLKFNAYPEDLLCSVQEIEYLLQTLDTNKSTGPDGISAKMLKSVAECIAPSVTKLMNQSIQSGCFPVFWKVSNIVPIPKLGDNSNPSNYRPVSLLPILSKLLERHIQQILMDYNYN